MIRHVVLVGLSGSGKSSVGRLVASSLGWTLIDTDSEIEGRTGRIIPDLFREEGETRFREIEAEVMAAALGRDEVVIATGGGAVANDAVWTGDMLGSAESLVVWLDADPATLAGRLVAQAAAEGAAADRPLLAAGDPVATLTGMRERRAGWYGRSDVTLDVSQRDPQAVADDVTELVRLGSGGETRVDLRVEGAASAIHVGMGSRHRLGEVVPERWPRARHIWVAVDAHVEPHALTVIKSLREQTGAPVQVLAVPPGESSKSLAGLSRLYDWMLEGGVERGDVLVAIGGGMVGDLAGFAAATVLRGIGLVQVPTTLLSMVDSSVGGKTGINHRTGKNLIGAFYQPHEVVIDPAWLQSLPPRELRSGWAEILKHGVIEPSTPKGTPPVLRSLLERNTAALSRVDSPITPWVIRRNVSLKARVVEADEREAGGRALLNFGHTVGHGIEAAGFALLHGEAVAVGMCAATSISRELGLIDVDHEQGLRDLIEGFDLPTRWGADPDEVRLKMQADKKKTGGRQRWVLPVRDGGVIVTTEVPDDCIARAIERVTGSGQPPRS